MKTISGFLLNTYPCRAFTLMELIIGMLIGALVLSSSMMLWRYSHQWLTTMDRAMVFEYDRNILMHSMLMDYQYARRLSICSDSIVFHDDLIDHLSVKYKVVESVIVREGIVRDTFRVLPDSIYEDTVFQSLVVKWKTKECVLPRLADLSHMFQ
jgi:prepilin-type N-terminal cleavage/methylation domain-containing protein